MYFVAGCIEEIWRQIQAAQVGMALVPGWRSFQA